MLGHIILTNANPHSHLGLTDLIPSPISIKAVHLQLFSYHRVQKQTQKKERKVRNQWWALPICISSFPRDCFSLSHYFIYSLNLCLLCSQTAMQRRG